MMARQAPSILDSSSQAARTLDRFGVVAIDRPPVSRQIAELRRALKTGAAIMKDMMPGDCEPAEVSNDSGPRPWRSRCPKPPETGPSPLDSRRALPYIRLTHA